MYFNTKKVKAPKYYAFSVLLLIPFKVLFKGGTIDPLIRPREQQIPQITQSNP